MGIKVSPTKSSNQKKAAMKAKSASQKKPKENKGDDQLKVKMIMPMQKNDEDWQAEEDLRTLMRAEEIKANSKRFSKAKEEARKQAARVSKIAK